MSEEDPVVSILRRMEKSMNEKFDSIEERLTSHDEQFSRLIYEKDDSLAGSVASTTAPTVKVDSPANEEKEIEKEKDSEFKIHGADKVSNKSALKTPKKNGDDTQEPQTLREKLNKLGADIFKANTPIREETKALMHRPNVLNQANGLRRIVEFKPSQELKFPLTIMDILSMKKEMERHFNKHGDVVLWRTVCSENLQRQICAEFGGTSHSAFLSIQEEFIFEALIAFAGPKNKKEFIDCIKDYQPSKEFMEQGVNLSKFPDVVYSFINAHIEGFMELYNVLMLHNKNLCPHAFQSDKIPGSGMIRDCMVGLFLNSFPHNIGRSMHDLIDPPSKTTFSLYVQEFREGLRENKKTAEAVSALLKAIAEINEKKRGSINSRIAKDTRLAVMEDQIQEPKIKFLQESQINAIGTSQSNSMGSREQASKKSMGCFHLVLRGKCPHGDKCLYSHNPRDVLEAAERMKAHQKKKASQLDEEISKLRKRVTSNPFHKKPTVNNLEQPEEEEIITEESDKKLISKDIVDGKDETGYDSDDLDSLPEGLY